MICSNCLKASVCKHKEDCQRLEKENVDTQLTVKPYGLTMSCSEKINDYNTGGIVSRGWMDSHTIQTPYPVTVTSTPISQENIETISKNVIENISEFEKNCEGYAHWKKADVRNITV